jgi:hypothetical protein
MKKLLIVIAVLLCNSSYAQTFKLDSVIKSVDSKLPYYSIDTIVLSNYSKSDLFSNALRYIADSFKDSRNVVEVKDVDRGEIYFHGNVSKPFTNSYPDKKGKIKYLEEEAKLFFKCKIYLKDNKFKIVLSSLEYPFTSLLDTGVNMPLQPNYDKPECRATGELAMALIKNLSARVNSKPANDF